MSAPHPHEEPPTDAGDSADFPPEPSDGGPDLGELLALPDVAERTAVALSTLRQWLRDGRLVAVRRDGVLVVPADLLVGGDVVKGLPGLVTVLRDARYDDEAVLRWLFTADDSLPGRPVDALRANRGTEVKRRAQALAF